MTIVLEAPSGSSAAADGHHGTAHGYRLGCRQDCCRAAYMRAKKRRQRFGKLTSDSGPVADHVRALLDAGASRQTIADAAGVHRTQIQRILRGDVLVVRQETRDRILAVTIAAGMGSVDATGATRRLRALLADGHGIPAIKDASGLSGSVLSRIIAGPKTVRAETVEAVTRAYRALSGWPGTNVRNRLRGERERWARPVHWECIDIDNPVAFPDWTGECGTERGWRMHHTHGLLPPCDPCMDGRRTRRSDRDPIPSLRGAA